MSDPEEEQAARLAATWASPTGWRRWSDVNNTVVGVWYLLGSALFFGFAGVLALVMRAQLAVPDNDLVSAETYDQLFTMHGSVMMFLFAVPIFEAVSIVLLPQMLGARDLPFPRLSAFGFWSFFLGGTFFCGTLFFGAAPSGGWFMYPPLSSAFQPGIGPDVWLLALSFVEVSAIAAAVELVVGVLKCRPPGMRIDLIPIYAWYILVVAVMLLFAFPPLIAGTLLLELERAFGFPFFDPARGGDPILWQHLFWLFGHPEVYIVFLPSVALVATILPTFSRVPLVAYPWVVLSAVGTGFLSFGLWVHHMFATGLPWISLALFSAASQAVAIPSAIQLAAFVATLWVGRPVLSVPVLFSVGGLALFVLGGITGVLVAVVPIDLQAHDSHFIVAHLHTVLIGGTLFPLLGGLYYWYPLVTGRLLSERVGKLAFWLTMVGFGLTFLPMHVTGLQGMARRVYTYPAGEGLGALNAVSTVGSALIGLGLLAIAIEVIRPKGPAAVAARNPWGAGTLEWLSEMPPDRTWGVRSVPSIRSRYPLWDQPELLADVDHGRGFLPDAEEGLRETLVTSPVDARPEQVLRVAPPSYLPLLAAVGVGGFFIASTFHAYAVALGFVAMGAVFILVWLWSGTAMIPEKERKNIGGGLDLPLYVSGSASVGWWGLFVALLSLLTAFLSVVFAWFFFWTIHADFPALGAVRVGPWGLGGLGVGAGWALVAGAVRWNRANQAGRVYLALVSGSVFAAFSVWLLFLGSSDLDPRAHAVGATAWVLTGWAGLQVALGIAMNGYCIARRLAGRLTARYDMDLVNVLLYWHFTAFTVLVAALVVVAFPRWA